MENRFGVKEVVVCVLIVVVMVMVGLNIKQMDRQWTKMEQMESQMADQTAWRNRIEDEMQKLRQSSALLSARPDATPQLLEQLATVQVMLKEVAKGSVDAAKLAEQLAELQKKLKELEAKGPAAGVPQNPEDLEYFKRLKAARARPDYARGDIVVEGMDAAPPKLNEITAQDIYSRIVYVRVLESLADYSLDTGKFVPVLAESWLMAADGLSCTFKLRKGVRFSSGDPLTAEDVVYTFQVTMNDKITDGRTREYYRHIRSVEALDPHTVRFNYHQVFYENFARSLLAIHSKRFLARYTDEQIRSDPALLMGTGPYKLTDATKYTPGEDIILVRNNDYWGPPGPWDRFVWRIITNEQAEEIEFRNGALDLFVPTPEQHELMKKDAALVERTQQHIYEHVRTGYSYIAWNQERKGKRTVFADKRVRQAMTMLVDRQRLVDEIFLGYATVASGPFSDLGPQADPSVKAWPYDPTKAVALLKEAGFKQGENGRLIAPDGKPFTIGFSYPSPGELYKKIALTIKDNMARGGINVELEPLEWSLMLERLNNKDFDAITLGWGAGGLESDIEQMFHTRTIKEGDNRNAYSNPQLDALIEKAHVTLDDAERMKAWQACHRILHEDQPYTFLTRPKVRLWMDKRIQNLQKIPIFGINYSATLSTPIEWYVPAKDQKRR